MQVVIVESPAKSKTINKYLGHDYKVLASFGHIRDLPSKDGSVRPDDDFAMTYQVDADAQKRVAEIAKYAKDADAILLATDPDREGEAISWHVLEVLKQKKALKKDAKIQRVVFNEITKKAVLNGINNPRDLDMDLINAQQARRALDYLVGFTLSPVLWRKLPGSRSAGRVQSVALRLICERESEIEAFRTQEYWDISGQFTTVAGEGFSARLTHLNGEKLEKFSLGNEAAAKAAVTALQGKHYQVADVTPKQAKRNPYAPFTTSTLQQEASRKLGFSAKRTMQVAQKLYEGIPLGSETVGLITYMRTDGVYVSGEAIAETRGLIEERFGKPYVPNSPRMYSAKAKNAQEAHEAIRPTSSRRTPEAMAQYLDADQAKLYTLIWKRMVASQMESAVLDQVVVDITTDDGKQVFRANGSVVKFPGFLALYREDSDDGKDDDSDRLLPAMKQGEASKLNGIKPEQHFTEPPPRYSEASLVKELEKLGIGRPSTYASIISVLQDRNYVRLDKKRFHPEARGRIVTAFLELYFKRYVEYDFTARLEEQLDEISAGQIDWKEVLRQFWNPFIGNVEGTKELKPSEILLEIEKQLAALLFPASEDGKNPHVCPSCSQGELHLKSGKFGAFLGCSHYPDCKFTRQLDEALSGEEEKLAAEGPQELGNDPATGFRITLRKGPYGWYVQLEDGEKKPKRASLPKGLQPEQVELTTATALLALPREVGKHPETKKPIVANNGRFGPYVAHNGVFASLSKDDDVLTIGMNRAMTLLAEKEQKSGAKALLVVGNHPEDGAEIAVFSGRYGPYVKHGKVNATLPKGQDPEKVSMELAMELLQARAASAPAKGGKKAKAPAKPKAAKAAKPAAKTAAKAKPAARKKAG